MRQVGASRGLELALEAWWSRRRTEIRTAFPAFVVEYDHTSRAATVQPSIRLRYSDGRKNEAHAPLSERPVVQVARGAGWVITHGLAPGDQVLCVAADRALDAWSAGKEGGLVDPRMRRYHAAMDAVVLGGLAPPSAPPPPGDPGELYLGREDGQVTIRLGSDGSARIAAGPLGAGATVEITPEGKVVVTPAPGQRVELGGAGPNPNVARVGDDIAPTATLTTVLNAMATVVNGIVPGTVTPLQLLTLTFQIGDIKPNTCPVGASDA